MALLMALRPKQWIKNSFLLAPAVFANNLFTIPTMSRVLGAFVIFCGIASSTYLINDILDRENDRTHPIKRFRPIASGALPTHVALGAAFALAIGGLIAAAFIDLMFFWTAFAYILTTVGYSSYFKHLVILDVMFLAAGFVLRVAAGAFAASVEASEWLVLCTLLLALFLGFAKRRHEMTLLEGGAQSHRRVLEQYSPELLDQMLVIVATSTIICYILYTVWPSTVEKFGTRHLVFTVPFVLYGILRYFFIIHQRDLAGDPTGSLLTDRPLLVNILLWGLVVVGVIYFRL